MNNAHSKIKPFEMISQIGFIGIFLAMIFMFLIVPLILPGLLTHLALQLCFTVMILSIIYTIRGEFLARVLGVIVAILFMIFDSLSLIEDSLFFLILADVFFCILLLVGIVSLYKMLWNKSEVDTNLIFAAITAYLLSGVLWGKLYLLINSIYPNSFHGIQFLNIQSDGLQQVYEVQNNLIYFSFTTLATLGFGDITPLVPIAKSLTLLEATYGQLFVAIFISKLVSIWKNSSKNVH